MLRQLRLCRVDAAILFGCRPSIIQRHFLGACSSHRRLLSDSPAAAAKDPRWVMLNRYCSRVDDSFVADAKTVADSRTRFSGLHLRVSLERAAPPASSFLYYDCPDSAPGEKDDDDYNGDDMSVDIVAAHSDSVLLRMGNGRCPSIAFEDSDYFVYRAGAAGPPSLSLLPGRDFLTKTESLCKHRPSLCIRSTGLLRRGENDFLVVELDLWYNRDARRWMFEFCVLRSGTGMRQWEWELMEPVPILRDDEDGELSQSGDDVVPVGDRYLCWVDYEDENGFFLCDMADDARPQVRYLPLPIEPSGRRSFEESNRDVFRIKYSMKMCSAGDSKVRFVSIDPRCCCGGPGRSTCSHSYFSFTVTTWTMDLSMDMESPMTWVKDGEIDCEEVWTLPGYEGLPRVNLECPVVSLDDPNVVCFLVSNRHSSNYEDHKVWMIQLNMKTKTLLSVVQSSNDPWSAYHRHLPAQLQSSDSGLV